jgi:hypothetical protein
MNAPAKKSKKVYSPDGEEWETYYLRTFSPERRAKIDAAVARQLAKLDRRDAKEAQAAAKAASSAPITAAPAKGNRILLQPSPALYADITKHAAARGISASEYLLNVVALFLNYERGAPHISR